MSAGSSVTAAEGGVNGTGAVGEAASPGSTGGTTSGGAAALCRPQRRTSLSAQRLAEPWRSDRPGIRWWWQSPVPVAELVAELRAIAAAGFGEVEIAFSPGFWADEPQRQALGAVLAEARRLGVGVAMTLGAAWPLQTPNTARGSAYAARELQYGVTWVGGGSQAGARTGSGQGATEGPAEISAPADGLDGAVTTPVPPPFDDPELERGGELVAVVAARVVKRGTSPRVVGSGNPWGKPTKIIEPERSTLLDQTSMTVLTGAVRGEGRDAVVTWSPGEVPGEAAGRAPGEGQWALMAFWSRDSEQGVTSFLDAAAARAALAYLDEHQIGEAGSALRAPGSTATELFEDSLELNADCLFWSPGMLERFRALRGYDPTPWLPLLIAHGQCRYWVPEEPPRPDFDSAAPDGAPTDLGRRVRADYDRTVTDLYVRDHLALIQDWAAGHGMRHKAQAAYGQNLEPVRSFRELVRCGGRAEVESLNSGDRVPMTMTSPTWRFALDWQRCCVGGAHQGGAVRVSTELGAQMDRCYDFSLADYRRMLDKEWAVGVTKPFVHGFATQAEDAPWPTQGRFGTIVSESWNHRHFPQWEHWRGLTDYWARGTAVLETGTPRADVAVYRDGFLTTAARGSAAEDATAPERLIDAEPLERHGYLVQVLDPVGLAEDDVVGAEPDAGAEPGGAGSRRPVEGAVGAGPGRDATTAVPPARAVLFPDGPAYRALVLDAPSLTPEAARGLARAAGAGLGVVIVGEPPSTDTGWGGQDSSAQVRQAVGDVLATGRAVTVAGWEEVPAALAGLGVRPRAQWEGPVLLSQVRDAEEGRYVLLYNPDASQEVTTTLSVEGEGRMEVVDLETGTVRPVASVVQDGRTVVEVALAALGLVVLRRVPCDPGAGRVDLPGPAGSAGTVGAAATAGVSGAVDAQAAYGPAVTAPGTAGTAGAAGVSGAVDAQAACGPAGSAGAAAVEDAGATLRRDAGAESAEPGPSGCLPSGRAGRVQAPEGAREVRLEGWSLSVVSEEPGGRLRIDLPGQGPVDWRNLEALKHVSGTGTYRVRAAAGPGPAGPADSSGPAGPGGAARPVGPSGAARPGGLAGPGGADAAVHSDPAGPGGADVPSGLAGPGGAGLRGARLALGRLGGSALVRVGGHELGPVLLDGAVVELGDLLAEAVDRGEEPLIEIEVRTTLRNAALAAGVYEEGPWQVENPTRPHGLLGPVRLYAGG